MNIKILNKQGATLLTAGKYCAEDIAVTIDSENLLAENIKKDISILGVTGTMESGLKASVTNGTLKLSSGSVTNGTLKI